ILFPDTGSTYWLSQYALPPGARLEFEGRFPYARHMSFNVYDANGQPVDRLNDLLIEPEAGATNPFRGGARRDGAERNYRISLVAKQLKAGAEVDDVSRAANTLYASQDGGTVQLWYRLYVPDNGRDAKGGVPLPEPVMIRADGSSVRGDALCSE